MRLNLKAKTHLGASGVPSRLGIIAAIVIVYLVWGSTYLGVRIAVESIPPFMLTSIRSLVAAGVLLIVLWLHGASLPARAQLRNAVLVGGLMFGGPGMMAVASQWVASGLVALAVAAVPIWAAIFAGFWGHWPGRLEWAGLLVGLSGMVLLNMDSGMQANPIGALALLVGPMMWAFGSMWSRRLSQPDGFMATAFQLFGGGIVLVIMSVVFHENLAQPPTTRSLVALVYLTFIGTLLAFSAYMYLIRTVRPVLATSYAYVNPVVAVFLGVVLGAEHITPVALIAMVVILTGVALLGFGKERKKKDVLE